jgi:hypothetical protein
VLFDERRPDVADLNAGGVGVFRKNSRQLNLLTSFACTDRLKRIGSRISMDGKGRCLDNIFISEKGHGGGWKLSRPLTEVTLRDVDDAVGAPPPFNIGPNGDPSECLVEKAVDAQLDASLREAEARLLAQFSEIRVEDLAREYESRKAEK